MRIPVAANLRIPGTTPYYGANGIQDYVDGFTHEGEFVLVAEDGANDLKNYPVKCVNGRIWVNNHAHVLQSKPEMADNKFLAYSISQADIEALLVGGGRSKLNAEVMMSIELVMPSLPEQISIGQCMTRLDHLITLHQKKCFLRSLSSFSIIAISWEQRKLGDLIIQGGSGGTPTATKSEYYGGTIPFLSIADIKDRDIKATEKTITETGLNNSAAWIVPKGAISLAMYASVGKVGILSMNSATSQAFFNMVFDNATIRNFVYYRLVKADFAKEWEPLISTGTQRNLNAEKVKKFSFCIPSIDEMKRVSDFLWDLDNLITLHQRKHGAGLYN